MSNRLGLTLQAEPVSLMNLYRLILNKIDGENVLQCERELHFWNPIITEELEVEVQRL